MKMKAYHVSRSRMGGFFGIITILILNLVSPKLPHFQAFLYAYPRGSVRERYRQTDMNEVEDQNAIGIKNTGWKKKTDKLTRRYHIGHLYFCT